MHQEFERISLDMLRSELADRNMRYTIETYGCQMNVRDSEIIAGMLDAVGMKSTEDRSEADLILFNTCCVRDHAEKRLLGNIGALPAKRGQAGLGNRRVRMHDAAKGGRRKTISQIPVCRYHIWYAYAGSAAGYAENSFQRRACSCRFR